MRLLLFAVTVILSAACSEDPADPAAGSTGVLDGTVEVYDAHLQRVDDASGILVRIYDSDGKKFETTTNADGLWEIALPFGVYSLDTIQHPNLMQLDHGRSNTFHPKGPIDWLGKGQRRLLGATRFCPDPLQTLVEIQSHSITIDSVFSPADTGSHSHHDTDVYEVTVHLTCSVKKSIIGGHSMSCTLLTSSGVVLKGQPVGLSESSTAQTLTITIRGLIRDFTELDNAKLNLKIESQVGQHYFEPITDPDNPGWSSNYRPLVVPIVTAEYPLK